MGTTVLWIFASMLLAKGRLNGDTGIPGPAESLEVQVWKTTGFIGTLTLGMRVDALFVAAGTDGTPTRPRQLLLALRNVEVIGSVASSHFGGTQRTTLRLTGEQVETIKALPPAVAEIVVTPAPKGVRTPPSENLGNQTKRGRRGRSARVGNAETATGDGPEERTWYIPQSSRRSWPSLWRSLIWVAVAYLLAACCMQMWLAPRRKLGQKKRRAGHPWQHRAEP
jgi:hypothetical protein